MSNVDPSYLDSLIGAGDYTLAATLLGIDLSPVAQATGSPGGTSTTVGGLDPTQSSGKAILGAILRDAGLSSPEAETYVSDLVTAGGTIGEWQARLNADLYDTGSTLGKIVAQKYPAIIARQKAGLPPITVGDYLSYQKTAGQLASKYGLPDGFVNKDFVDQRLTGDVSLSELEQRFQGYQQAAYQVPQSDRDELQRLYGIGAGDLTAFYADQKTTLPLIQQRFLAAQQSGAAVRSGFGPLSQTEAEGAAAAGLTPDQTLKATGELANESQLFNALPGENADNIDRATQISAALGGNAAAQLRIQQRAAARRASMEQAGEFAAGKSGISGIGVSTT